LSLARLPIPPHRHPTKAQVRYINSDAMRKSAIGIQGS
jgi:hypothetical protein